MAAVRNSMLFCALLWGAGCTVGGFDGPGDPGPGDPGPGDTGDTDPEPDPDPSDPDPDPEPEPDYSLALTPPSQTLTLGTSSELALSLTSSDFSGPVVLTASGAPESWEVTFSPSATVSLQDGETIDITVNVEAPSSAEATTADLSIDATAAPGERKAVSSITVENLLLVPIGIGTNAGPHPFPEVADVQLGATVRFVNYDNLVHRIHAGDGDAGFDHQPPPGMEAIVVEGMPGGIYEVTITEPGSYGYYCHEHGEGTGVGSIEVLAP